MLDQCFAHPTAVDHIEHAGRHGGFFRRANHRIGYLLGRGHVAAMGLEHHRAAGGQSRRGVAPGSGKCQRKITRPEYCHRPQPDTVLAQVGTRQWLTLRQGPVDARAIEIATPQHLGEQAHLPAGAATLADDPCGRQRGFAAHQGYELIPQRIQFIGDRIEKLCTTLGTQAAVSRIRRGGGPGGGVDFVGRRLNEGVGQCLTGFGVDAVQSHAAQRAALAADVVVAKNWGHRYLLKECRRCRVRKPHRQERCH
ncbi:hypothetical protein D3C76_979380 [compost metagenome]